MARYSYIAVNEPGDFCRLCESVPWSPENGDGLPSIGTWTDEEVGKIRSVLCKLTALRIQNDYDAEDLVQDTLLTATTKLPEYSLQKGRLVWCMGVLRKKVGNYYRKAGRYLSLDEHEALSWQLSLREIRTRSPEAGLRHAELDALVEEIVARFPLQERRPMELFLAGLTTCEIARMLRPERYQNIVNRIYRGRRKLARQLARYGYAPPGWRCGAARQR